MNGGVKTGSHAMGDMPVHSHDRVIIDGTQIDNVSMQEAIQVVDEHIQRRQSLLVVTPNVDHLLRRHQDDEFRRAYDTAGLILADGAPLLWLARLQGTPLKAKVSGSDFLRAFARVAAQRGRRIFLLGGQPGIAQQTGEMLSREFPGLIVAGAHSPSNGFEDKKDENCQIIETIKRHNPDILFVAAGTPKQEKWLFRHWSQLDPICCIGVGAAFDFLSGRIRRAPLWMRNHGLEWFWRLMHEPRRLFYRYIIEDFPFFLRLLVRTLARRVKGVDS